ncbi:hypothetical protein AVEN_72005-1 [Araneus ventricosus]|uniref:Uncharacterized protein n=1 Tax=Araneus ventricosus TaxID=182803 RepID=A0A4Y2DD52_ARAVE|nr:hypothetical protein AVEN_72005-1 [Araneus ventricosus]
MPITKEEWIYIILLAESCTIRHVALTLNATLRKQIVDDTMTELFKKVKRTGSDAGASRSGRPKTATDEGNQSIGQYLSVHKDSSSNPTTNSRLEEAVVVNWPKMMKFKAS